MTAVPVLWVDLDGTVRKGYEELGRFVNGPEDVEVFHEVPDLLRAYRSAGWRIVAISNQGGIALGHMTMERCLAAMVATTKQCGEYLDRIMFCPHHPSARDPLQAHCWCRKPRIGLIVEADLLMRQEHLGEVYPPHLGLLVGDRAEDQQCAVNAGLQFMDAAVWRASHAATRHA